MKPGNLARRLRREAVANPKKAAILGILFVVSLYFWIPLVGGWINADEASATAAPQAAASAAVGSPSTAPSVAKKTEDHHSWRQIDRWRHNDPRTMTAHLVVKTRDPFEFPKTEIVKTESEEGPQPLKKIITPEDAGLSLSGTIIGPRNRMARINGKTYSVGQSVEAGDDEAAVTATFKLTEINSRGVVLQSGSERFELVLPDPRNSGKIEIQRYRP